LKGGVRGGMTKKVAYETKYECPDGSEDEENPIYGN
jgi:hypothetical protein